MGNKGIMKSDFKNIPLNDRPREKALNNGVEFLSDQELLAIILKCGTKGQSVLDLSNTIMKKYHNFSNLINCNYNELISIQGINKAKAIEIMSIINY